MAYVSQDLKRQLAPKIKSVLKKYNVKGTIGVRHHSTLVVTLRSGTIDLSTKNRNGDILLHYSVNPYGNVSDSSDDVRQQLFAELYDAANEGNWDKSDIQTDYFNVGWYTDIQVGEWNKPYQFIIKEEKVEG